MTENDNGELRKEIIENRALIRELMQKIDLLNLDVKSGKTAVQAVPQRSQPPQLQKMTIEVIEKYEWHKKRISTYYSRCFGKRSKTKTLIANCTKVLESIEFVLPYTTEKADIDKYKKRKDAVSKQFNSIIKKNTNVLLRRV